MAGRLTPALSLPMPPEQKFDPATCRADFPMLADAAGGRALAYLDTAASSQTPLPVLAAMDDYYRTCRANVHRGMYRASEETTARYEAGRRAVAAFLNAAEDEVVFTAGATASLNLAARLLEPRLAPGDEIVATEMEHHANLIPWQQLARRTGAKLRLIPVRDDFTLDLDAARALVGERTRIVAFAWASNVLGTVNPAAELCTLAKSVGAVSVVDAAQAVGHLPVDVKQIGCDFLAFSGHKMLGPTGTGVLFGRREVLAGLEPVNFGGDMIRDVTFEDAAWADAPYRFEPGTPNIAGVIGLGAAVEYLARLGVPAIAEHESALARAALAHLGEIPGIKILGPTADKPRLGNVSFVIDGLHPHDVATVLDAGGVCVRAGHHCAMPLHRKFGFMVGTVRASFGPYSLPSDTDALVAGLLKAKEIFRV
jgi:cysteine desulfurase/selenocysteine lyase